MKFGRRSFRRSNKKLEKIREGKIPIDGLKTGSKQGLAIDERQDCEGKDGERAENQKRQVENPKRRNDNLIQDTNNGTWLENEEKPKGEYQEMWSEDSKLDTFETSSENSYAASFGNDSASTVTAGAIGVADSLFGLMYWASDLFQGTKPSASNEDSSNAETEFSEWDTKDDVYDFWAADLYTNRRRLPPQDTHSLAEIETRDNDAKSICSEVSHITLEISIRNAMQSQPTEDFEKMIQDAMTKILNDRSYQIGSDSSDIQRLQEALQIAVRSTISNKSVMNVERLTENVVSNVLKELDDRRLSKVATKLLRPSKNKEKKYLETQIKALKEEKEALQARNSFLQNDAVIEAGEKEGFPVKLQLLMEEKAAMEGVSLASLENEIKIEFTETLMKAEQLKKEERLRAVLEAELKALKDEKAILEAMVYTNRHQDNGIEYTERLMKEEQSKAALQAELKALKEEKAALEAAEHDRLQLENSVEYTERMMNEDRAKADSQAALQALEEARAAIEAQNAAIKLEKTAIEAEKKRLAAMRENTTNAKKIQSNPISLKIDVKDVALSQSTESKSPSKRNSFVPRSFRKAKGSQNADEKSVSLSTRRYKEGVSPFGPGGFLSRRRRREYNEAKQIAVCQQQQSNTQKEANEIELVLSSKDL